MAAVSVDQKRALLSVTDKSRLVELGHVGRSLFTLLKRPVHTTGLLQELLGRPQTLLQGMGRGGGFLHVFGSNRNGREGLFAFLALYNQPLQLFCPSVEGGFQVAAFVVLTGRRRKVNLCIRQFFLVVGAEKYADL